MPKTRNARRIVLDGVITRAGPLAVLVAILLVGNVAAMIPASVNPFTADEEEEGETAAKVTPAASNLPQRLMRRRTPVLPRRIALLCPCSTARTVSPPPLPPADPAFAKRNGVGPPMRC
jgi:hypothetical protein